jgi:anti-sigma factor ChrR (cupin superfamily)
MDDCLTTQGLIPWLANGTLSGAEAARALVHTLRCTECRVDLARAMALCRQMRETMAEVPRLPDKAWQHVASRLGDRRGRSADAARRLLTVLSVVGAPAGLRAMVAEGLDWASGRPVRNLALSWIPVSGQ